MSKDSHELLANVANGDKDASKEFFERYVQRVVPLARKYIGPKLQPKFDAEDVAQSVFRSFFRKAENAEFTLHRSGSLWAILAQITINKVRKRVEKELAQKRDPGREVSPTSSFEILNREPSPEDAEILVDELQRFMDDLKPLDRRILELRLQDEGYESISREVGVSEATIRRVLHKLDDQLHKRLQSD